jgi:hypothetical protein
MAKDRQKRGIETQKLSPRTARIKEGIVGCCNAVQEKVLRRKENKQGTSVQRNLLWPTEQPFTASNFPTNNKQTGNQSQVGREHRS